MTTLKIKTDKMKEIPVQTSMPDDDELCVFITGRSLDTCKIDIVTRFDVRLMAGIEYRFTPWEDDKLTTFADNMGYNCMASEVEDYLVDNFGDEIAEFLQDYYKDNVKGYDAKADCETPAPWCAPWFWAKDWYGNGFLISALTKFAIEVCADKAIHEAFSEGAS